MAAKMTPEQIKDSLGYFTGTEAYHRWSMLFMEYVLTDGAKFLSDQCGAFWLMDLIASYRHAPTVRREEFQVWRLKKTGERTCDVTCDDGNDNILVTQAVAYTDFPLEEVKLYCISNGDGTWTILLPSEY